MDLQTENTDILQTIVAHKQQEVDEWMRFMPPRQLMAKVEERMAKEEQPPASMRQALLQSDTGIIAEFKRKSPSKGRIKREGRAGVIPMAYQQAGATALSILTDNHFFGGYDEFVSEARASGVTLPILYKNFIISEYQLLQARFCGASAVLLIAADLEPDMYGINNRNLGTFITDVNNSFRMAERLPKDGCKVSESGIGDPNTVMRLRQAGFNGFLMGEHFMKADNPGDELARFIGQLKQHTQP